MSLSGPAKSGYLRYDVDGASCGISFDWKVASQEGMKSYIDWTITMYNNTSGYYFRPLSLDDPPTYEFRISTEDTVLGVYEGELVSMAPKESHVVHQGTITLTRDAETNMSFLRCSMIVEGEYYLTSYGTLPGLDGVFDGQQYVDSWDVETTTQFGSGAQITSAPNFTDEENLTISYEYDRGGIVTDVTIEAAISFTGDTDNIAYRPIPAVGVGTYTFEFSDAEREILWTAFNNGNDKATVRVYLKTIEKVNDETNAPVILGVLTTIQHTNHTPVFEPRIYDTNEVTKLLTGNENHLIRYMSTAAFEINATPRKGGSSITSQYIQNGDRIVENIAAGTFGTVTSNTFYFSATDDRLFTGTASYSLSEFDGEFINYIKLTNKATHKPITPAGEVEVTISGKYFNYNFGAAQNQISLQYMALLKGEESGSFSEPVVFTPTMVDTSTYSHTFTIPNLDYTKQYNITVRVNDLLMSQDSTFVAVSMPVFDWSRDDFAFYVPVNINGAEVPSIVDQGKSNPWTYRLWSDGVAECWAKANFSTAAIRTLGSLYTSGNLSATNIQYPFEFTENPVVIVSLGADNTYGAVMIAPGGSGALSTFQQASTTQTGMYTIISANSLDTTSYTLNYYVKGRWK